jgi:parallel beta-helix repeat protein
MVVAFNNIIYNNIIQNNTEYGIYLYKSQNNLIYNNLFNNTNNFYFDGTIYSNYWNTTKQLGQRIYSPGNYIGGNYWTNSTGNGYSDICVDDDKDGFCDLPYDLFGDGTNVDYLPLSDEYVPPSLPPEITIFSPLNQSYYGSIDFVFKAIDDLDENFTVKAYLNNQLEYENLYYQNNTQISYSKSLPTGTYNFTVYAEDSYGASSQQEVIFTSLGYCGDSICQADYENNMNCFKDCGGTARQFTVGIGSVVLAFGGLMLLATAFASSPTEGKDYVFKIFIAVIGIILMVYGIIYLINL